MRLKRPPTRSVTIQLSEKSGRKYVKGTSRCITVYETSVEEVYELVMAKLKEVSK